jgi:glutathione S-transferase
MNPSTSHHPYSHRARALCHTIEHWSDTTLQPLAMRLHCHADAPPAELQRALANHLDHANALLADASFVLGEEPSMADFALYLPLAWLRQSPLGRSHVRAWPLLDRFVDRMAVLERQGAERALPTGPGEH